MPGSARVVRPAPDSGFQIWTETALLPRILARQQPPRPRRSSSLEGSLACPRRVLGAPWARLRCYIVHGTLLSHHLHTSPRRQPATTAQRETRQGGVGWKRRRAARERHGSVPQARGQRSGSQAASPGLCTTVGPAGSRQASWLPFLAGWGRRPCRGRGGVAAPLHLTVNICFRRDPPPPERPPQGHHLLTFAKERPGSSTELQPGWGGPALC